MKTVEEALAELQASGGDTSTAARLLLELPVSERAKFSQIARKITGMGGDQTVRNAMSQAYQNTQNLAAGLGYNPSQPPQADNPFAPDDDSYLDELPPLRTYRTTAGKQMDTLDAEEEIRARRENKDTPNYPQTQANFPYWVDDDDKVYRTRFDQSSPHFPGKQAVQDILRDGYPNVPPPPPQDMPSSEPPQDENPFVPEQPLPDANPKDPFVFPNPKQRAGDYSGIHKNPLEDAVTWKQPVREAEDDVYPPIPRDRAHKQLTDAYPDIYPKRPQDDSYLDKISAGDTFSLDGLNEHDPYQLDTRPTNSEPDMETMARAGKRVKNRYTFPNDFSDFPDSEPEDSSSSPFIPQPQAPRNDRSVQSVSPYFSDSASDDAEELGNSYIPPDLHIPPVLPSNPLIPRQNSDSSSGADSMDRSGYSEPSSGVLPPPNPPRMPVMQNGYASPSGSSDSSSSSSSLPPNDSSSGLNGWGSDLDPLPPPPPVNLPRGIEPSRRGGLPAPAMQDEPLLSPFSMAAQPPAPVVSMGQSAPPEYNPNYPDPRVNIQGSIDRPPPPGNPEFVSSYPHPAVNIQGSMERPPQIGNPELVHEYPNPNINIQGSIPPDQREAIISRPQPVASATNPLSTYYENDAAYGYPFGQPDPVIPRVGQPDPVIPMNTPPVVMQINHQTQGMGWGDPQIPYPPSSDNTRPLLAGGAVQNYGAGSTVPPGTDADQQLAYNSAHGLIPQAPELPDDLLWGGKILPQLPKGWAGNEAYQSPNYPSDPSKNFDNKNPQANRQTVMPQVPGKIQQKFKWEDQTGNSPNSTPTYKLTKGELEKIASGERLPPNARRAALDVQSQVMTQAQNEQKTPDMIVADAVRSGIIAVARTDASSPTMNSADIADNDFTNPLINYDALPAPQQKPGKINMADKASMDKHRHAAESTWNYDAAARDGDQQLAEAPDPSLFTPTPKGGKWSLPQDTDMSKYYQNPGVLTDPTRERTNQEFQQDQQYTPFNFFKNDMGTAEFDPSKADKQFANPYDEHMNPVRYKDMPSLYQRNLDIPGFGDYDRERDADGNLKTGWKDKLGNMWGNFKEGVGNMPDKMNKFGDWGQAVGGGLSRGLGGLTSGLGAIQNAADSVYGTLKTAGKIYDDVSNFFTGETPENKALREENRRRLVQQDDADKYWQDQLRAAGAQQTDMENAYGKIAWTGSAEDGTRRMTAKLDKYQQKKKDLASDYADYLAEQGKGLGADAEGGLRDEVRTSLLSQFDRANSQRFADEQRALEQKLANQGLSPDSNAFRKQMNALKKEQESARQAATDSANVQSYSLGSQRFNDRMNAFGQQQNLFNAYDNFKDPSLIYQSGAQHGGNVFTGDNYQRAQQIGNQQNQFDDQLQQQMQMAKMEDSRARDQLKWQSGENLADRQGRSQDLQAERDWKTQQAQLDLNFKQVHLTAQQKMFAEKLANELGIEKEKLISNSQWRHVIPKMVNSAGQVLSGAANVLNALWGHNTNEASAALSNAQAEYARAQTQGALEDNANTAYGNRVAWEDYTHQQQRDYDREIPVNNDPTQMQPPSDKDRAGRTPPPKQSYEAYNKEYKKKMTKQVKFAPVPKKGGKGGNLFQPVDYKNDPDAPA